MRVGGSGSSADYLPKGTGASKDAGAAAPAPKSTVGQALPNTMPPELISISEKYLHGFSPTDIKSKELFDTHQKADALMEKLEKKFSPLPSNTKDLLIKNPEFIKNLEAKLATRDGLHCKENFKLIDGSTYTGCVHPSGMTRTLVPHRLGALVNWRAGVRQEGWFDNGKLVKGILTTSVVSGTKTTYEGTFSNNELNGPNCKRNQVHPDGTTVTWSGTFQSDELEGSDGVRVETRPKGSPVTMITDEGSFFESQLYGPGKRTETGADGKTTVSQGRFREGIFIGP